MMVYAGPSLRIMEMDTDQPCFDAFLLLAQHLLYLEEKN